MLEQKNHKTMRGGELKLPAAVLRPRIAIVDSNTLAAIGLKGILQEVMPMLEVDVFSDAESLAEAGPEGYVHYFAAMTIALDNRPFFLRHQRKTIVLTPSADPSSQLSGFHSLCVNQPEKALLKSILRLEQMAHGHGQNLPPVVSRERGRSLSAREAEVLALIVQGFINKEIADRLCISLSTVITHRRNIMEKLGARSVAALTIYAVTHGYVDINSI